MKRMWPECKRKGKKCSLTNDKTDCVSARSACSPILEAPLQVWLKDLALKYFL